MNKIKEAKFFIARNFAKSLNLSFRKWKLLRYTKSCKVIFLRKSGFKLELNKYRPIPILSILKKIHEIILRRQLIDLWQKYSLFAISQFGFKKKNLQILLHTCMDLHILEKNNPNNLVFGVFSNFARAFDYVNYQVLLDKFEPEVYLVTCCACICRINSIAHKIFKIKLYLTYSQLS